MALFLLELLPLTDFVYVHDKHPVVEAQWTGLVFDATVNAVWSVKYISYCYDLVFMRGSNN